MKRLALVLLLALSASASTLPNAAPGMSVVTNIEAVQFGGQIYHHSCARFVATELGTTRQVTLRTADGWQRTINVDELATIRGVEILVFPTANEKVPVWIIEDDAPARIDGVPLERFQHGPFPVRGRVVRK